MDKSEIKSKMKEKILSVVREFKTISIQMEMKFKQKVHTKLENTDEAVKKPKIRMKNWEIESFQHKVNQNN